MVIPLPEFVCGSFKEVHRISHTTRQHFSRWWRVLLNGLRRSCRLTSAELRMEDINKMFEMRSQLQLCMLLLLTTAFISVFSKLYTKQISIYLCMNQQLRKTMSWTWRPSSVYLSLSHVYHCTADKLFGQHNYVFTFMVAVAVVQVCACVCVHVSMYMCMSFASLHSTPLHSYQQMLPKPPALSRLMNQRQVPEGKHVHCHMSLSWMAAFGMCHMP